MKELEESLAVKGFGVRVQESRMVAQGVQEWWDKRSSLGG